MSENPDPQGSAGGPSGKPGGGGSDKVVANILPSGAAAKADPASLEQAYVRNHWLIYNLLYCKTWNRELTEDLVSRTFMKAQHYARRKAVRWRPLLYKIARNEWIQYERYRHRHPTSHENVLWIPSPHPGPDIVLEEEQRHGRVRECIERLDEIDQDIIILHIWMGMTLSETAETLEKPEGTIKSRFSRAKRKLEGMLKAELADQPEGGASSQD
jgi:RNA polymerase sigma factor (sigma-70 family)